MKEEKKSRDSLKIIILIAVTIFATCFIYEYNKILISKNNKNNQDVKESKTIAVEKVDINAIGDNTIEEETNNDNKIINKNTITQSQSTTSCKKNSACLIAGNFLSDGVVTTAEANAMKINTANLQYLVNTYNSSERTIIELPSGTYYFSKGGEAKNEDYVIKLTNNTTIKGSGTSENEATILKPYAPDNTIEKGLDMFYYNHLTDTKGAEAKYLENVSFSNFVIDGNDVRAKKYTSAGKGFMINLCKNCTWDNMVVKNTDGTGFGMDNLIDSKITNSTAINCGKLATTTSYGASGFGIGTGYSNEESVLIENCTAIGNKKYGFFFEHQGYFENGESDDNRTYKATKAVGFTVKNSTATGNLYNFGANRGNDVSYINCSSTKDNTTIDGTPVGYTQSDIYFTDQSRRTKIENFQTDNMFTDVSKSSPYYDAIKWAYLNSMIYGVGNYTFGLNVNATRADVVTILWRYSGRKGDVVFGLHEDAKVKTDFKDVSSNALYAGAVSWAAENKITNGTSSTTFSPNKNVTREQFVTMLWRYAGSPNVKGSLPFKDVKKSSPYYKAIKWAYKKNITNGTSNTTFSPKANCTREQVITMIYRYNNTL